MHMRKEEENMRRGMSRGDFLYIHSPYYSSLIKDGLSLKIQLTRRLIKKHDTSHLSLGTKL